MPLSLVAHHAFCPRRAWLELQGERTDTAQMAHGTAEHAPVDEQSTSRAPRVRALDVGSEELQLVGRCDTVEVSEDGTLTVVEHKAVPVRRSSEPTFPQRIQLALQALCLREQGYVVSGAAVWFTTTRRRVNVRLDHSLIAEARAQVALTRAVIARSTPPDPLEDDPRCGRCSHVSICLPDEHRRRPTARRISVADPVGRVLHLATAGSRASLRRGQVQVRAGDDPPATVPLGQVAGLLVHGNADVSAALLRELLERGFPIVWCAWSGRVVGWASSAGAPNGDARGPQHRLSMDRRLVVARAIVAGKIRNQATILRRHGCEERIALRSLARDVARAATSEALFGIEGRAASLYFRCWPAILGPEWATVTRRTRRPARDPVNAALNLVYGLLLADLLRSILACGLDPAGGVFHSAGHNKPALALDLMEEFRPPVADSAVIWAINNAELRSSDFRTDFDAVRLSQRGRNVVIAAYERRATSEFRHPHFGYRVQWRRAMEVQARMLLAFVLGERNDYRPIELR